MQWRGRPESPRKVPNRALLIEIRRVHTANRGRYGAPRIHATLRADGQTASRGRAAQKATDAAETLPSSAKDAMAKAMSFAENNVNAAFDLAQKLVRAKDVSEVLALQSEFAKSQMAAMQTQVKELGAVAQDAIASATRK